MIAAGQGWRRRPSLTEEGSCLRLSATVTVLSEEVTVQEPRSDG
jgi:hypothetical protein